MTAPRTADAKALANIFRLAQESVAAAQERLAAARLARARLAARLADEYNLTHEEIAALLPDVSRQRVGQWVTQGRVALASNEGSSTGASSGGSEESDAGLAPALFLAAQEG